MKEQKNQAGHIPIERPTVVVLAAGKGRRFQQAGGTSSKLHAQLLGRRVLDWTLKAVRESGLPLVCVEPDPERVSDGMGDSIARGVAMSEMAAGWLILPGDLPLIQPATLQYVAQQLAHHSVHTAHAVIRTVVEATPGHPVGFTRTWRSQLLQLQGEQGAASLVQQAKTMRSFVALSVSDTGCALDIDTPQQLKNVEKMLLNQVDMKATAHS
ncbi:nucleotidyltransferase family protein [Comamonas aquatica]|uniref:Nucleotidyltransferase family protein n=1 Tax=Comamonas aquatica TaxID=225991 RepID=A0AA42W518_9BURK|nr:nucleotidyltransferase family protein [Comamonas aquatica]MDH0496107.1 nucleotidyltransferase family protein [Comamonas aquatica]MDH1428417.1 nucleotidyltransferase family protein [Comamonas aquatica]MDH1607744.1 nucleotidyltransferase family protein [Comamonas aquatica]MDH1619503.1 nucleotidyltransferase family protein [Comamonas aquatica]MDH2007475.1 nucleotidyltransferase family protein [Comamonas aquatica]